MKKRFTIAVLISLALLPLMNQAQTVDICIGQSATLTALNNSALTGPSYSMNPGAISSSNPTFAVSPSIATTYTLYTTGTNSNSALVTTTNTVLITVHSLTFNVVSQQAFTLGCASKSLDVITITNVQTFPSSGGAVSYTLLAPGMPTVLPLSGTLSVVGNYSVNAPGTWSAVVRDGFGCDGWHPFTVTTNTSAPNILGIGYTQTVISCASPTIQVSSPQWPGMAFLWLPSGLTASQIPVSANLSAPTSTIASTITLQVTDQNNACMSTTAFPIYQNLFPPNAQIAMVGTITCQTPSVLISNMSTTGIPPFTFPTNYPVIATLWQGPAPQPTLGMSSTYVASTPGIYTLTVLDQNNGCTSTGTTLVSSLNPSASFSHTITSGVAAFSDLSTGVNQNTQYFWNFGDGHTSTAQNPTHTYQSAGSFPVTLKVMNYMPSLCADSIVLSVNVNGISCTANSNFSMVPTSTAQVWSAVPAYPWNVSAATWDWGDNSSSNTLYTSHQYSAAGMYNICLSVTVSCVASSSTCTSYSVYRSSGAANVIAVNVVQPNLISGVNEISQDMPFGLKVYPNPNSGIFALTVSNMENSLAALTIKDVSGRVLHAESIMIVNGSEPVQIKPKDLQAGVYFITLSSDRRTQAVKMIVTK